MYTERPSSDLHCRGHPKQIDPQLEPLASFTGAIGSGDFTVKVRSRSHCRNRAAA